jgi:hypothetical protein
MTVRRVAFSGFALGCILALSSQTIARADEASACVAAYEGSQLLRRDGKLVEARAQLLVCAQPSCPGVTSGECTRWLHEVNDAIPSVVLWAKDGGGHDLPDVKVLVDGRPLADRIDGKGVFLDPGEHVLRFESAIGAPIEQRVVAHQGEKNRLIGVVFHRRGENRQAAAQPAPRPVPAGVYALGGVALAALVVGTVLDVTARIDWQHLHDRCAPACDASEVDSARQRMLVGDVALGAGVVSLGLAAYFFFTRPGGQAPRTTGASVDALPGGLRLQWRATF